MKSLYGVGLAALAALFPGGQAMDGDQNPLLPVKFRSPPVGHIKPQGWLRDQMQLMADGLAGHEFDFYKYVANSSWVGGEEEYSSLNEGFPYWFNGIVPLAYALDDDRLKEQIDRAVTYVLDNQHDDGWIGPEQGHYRNFWARYPFFLGLTQLMEADVDRYGERGLAATYKFLDLMHSMLANGLRGYLRHPLDELNEEDVSWGRVRVCDMMLTLYWLLEEHPPEDPTKLLEIMKFLVEGALDWAHWYSDDVFIRRDLNLVPVNVTAPLFPYVHAVNVGQGLKAGAVFHRFTGNDTHSNTSRRAVDWTFEHHGSASGSVVGDERLAGLAPFYGAELCTVVEAMFSLSYLYKYFGDAQFAARTELAAFNELPSHFMPDYWARAYISSPNQPWAKNIGSEKPYWNVNSWASGFGMEVNYPCCTVNHPQGWPKFVDASWVLVGDDGLANVLLGPSTVTTTLPVPGGIQVTVWADTKYPFSDKLKYRVLTNAPFNFHVRIPDWANLSATTISGPAIEPGSPVQPDPVTGLHKLEMPEGFSEVTVSLATDIRLEVRGNDTVAVHRGALLYSLQLDYDTEVTWPKNYATNEPLPDDYPVPSQSRDYNLVNTSRWDVAIDPGSLAFHTTLDESTDSLNGLPNPLFAPNVLPVSISARACFLTGWGLYMGLPDAPPTGDRRRCEGGAFDVVLTPLGGAQTHMVELPTVELGEESYAARGAL
ncbi:hypothetical protein BDY21DRAFT_360085 [Lineolata rhizophorae]|uniref:Non-reducing end beta-L-arabinofuranosidase-like GH127 catalytic domain-containing protein n=1 Tax=Lineolata rhizophorae TaxID=578093 RepID=A0A6A6PDM1_9PEZI|nr:hypothetical protein BDY21DRAFT_360085 [Lineolata rhizophorae]